MTVIRDYDGTFEFRFPVAIVGGGSCGMCAALAASDLGVDALVIERDAVPAGSTGMSTGLIPAAGTPEQAAQGIADDGARFAADIVGKAGADCDPALIARLAGESAETVGWLQRHGVPLTLLEGFTYAGHSVRRMYGTPNRTGSELMAALSRAVDAAGATILTDATVTTIFVGRDGRVRGIGVTRPGGAVEEIGCDALILACCGFGGNAELVRQWTPEIAAAAYHGHPGNQGDAVRWGMALGAALGSMDAYQGHGNVAAGHGIVLNWPSIIEGGFQLNLHGQRFFDESIGYSAAAAQVHAQPEGLAWTIFDARIASILMQFDDYHDVVRAGAVVTGADPADLAARTRLPHADVREALAAVARYATGAAVDPFGRDFTTAPPLAPPYHAVRVTGALLHTQGGLMVDGDARVLDAQGRPFPNLFAGGGAARGVSGAGCKGYIAGNGLLTATTLGKLAGRAAARLADGADLST